MTVMTVKDKEQSDAIRSDEAPDAGATIVVGRGDSLTGFFVVESLMILPIHIIVNQVFGKRM